jgi:probable rRNA maturation factor
VDDPPQPDHLPVDEARWEHLALAALTAEGAPIDVEVGLSFVDEAEMAALNREHLGGDGPTDVLSFPLDYADGIPGAPAEGEDHIPAMAGDIVICLPVAARNAPAHAGSLDDELALLVVHAVLHLVGYDHGEPEERDVMQRRERELLDVLHGPLARDPWADPIESAS